MAGLIKMTPSCPGWTSQSRHYTLGCGNLGLSLRAGYSMSSPIQTWTSSPTPAAG